MISQVIFFSFIFFVLVGIILLLLNKIRYCKDEIKRLETVLDKKQAQLRSGRWLKFATHMIDPVIVRFINAMRPYRFDINKSFNPEELNIGKNGKVHKHSISACLIALINDLLANEVRSLIRKNGDDVYKSLWEYSNIHRTNHGNTYKQFPS